MVKTSTPGPQVDGGERCPTAGDWLRAGILDGDRYLFPEAGVPQGGVISPLLCNVALHGFEKTLLSVSKRYRIAIIRYADDLVIISEDLETLLKVKREAETWLAEVGLRLKPSKTRVTHTLNEHEGNVGFDFPSTSSGQAWGSTSGNTGWEGITHVPTGESRDSRHSSSRARKPASDN